jgi:SAM-dependent methyltransferase
MEEGTTMSVEVLQNQHQYREARRRLRERGLDCVSSRLLRALRKLKLTRRVAIGDVKKSWDILRTVEFIEQNLGPDDPILDIGAYGSEMPCILHALGFKKISGIDLNPDMQSMPHADSIRYCVADLMKTPFDNGEFGAVTAISVIEHGFDVDRLLAELARIIRPGGYFLASVDYWPRKIDTSGIEAYGMDWTIFSEPELNAFFERAAASGFVLHGPARFASSERPVSWLGKDYTFAWFALTRSGAGSGRERGA